MDDQSLFKSNDVSQEIAQVLYSERFYWIRIIKTYVCNLQGDEQSWKEVVTFPLQIVAEYGNGQLCQHVLRKKKNKNPQLNCEIVRDIHHIKDSVVWKFSTTKNEKESAISSKTLYFI